MPTYYHAAMAKPPVTRRRFFLRILGILAVLLPVGCFGALLLTYAVNVPWLDDLDAFLTFILAYSDAATVGDKLNWLLVPNNEHRILTAKLITVAMRWLTGEVNFRWLIFAAYGFLFGTFVLFYRVFRTLRLPLLAFAPVCFIFWQPQYYLTSLWALTGLQHEVVIFLTLSAIYLLSEQRRGWGLFAGAVALQVLASLSMSNGLFGWVAGALVLALSRRWYPLGVWLAVAAATFVFYFHDFQNAQGNGSSIAFLLQKPHIVVSAFFTFAGALLDFFPTVAIFRRSILPTLFGLILVALVLWLLFRMYWAPRQQTDENQQQRRFFFTGCYAFLFVNALTIAVLRPRFGYDVMLVSNYMIYPAVLTALVYLNGLSEFRSFWQSRWMRTGLVMSVMVWVISYGLHWPQIALRKQTLLSFAYNQRNNAIGLGPNWGSPFADLTRRAMGQVVKRGIYHYPAAYFTPYESLLKPARQVVADPALVLQVEPAGSGLLVGTAFNALKNPVNEAAIVVQSDRLTYLFPSALRFRTGAFYLGRPMRTVQADVVSSMLAPGTYRIGILTPTDPTQPLRFSRQQLTISPQTGN